MRLLIIILILASTSSSYSADYYVSPTGNNSNSGIISSPWQTVQFGVDQLTAGDNLFLRAGTYFEKIDITVSGTSSARISVKNYQLCYLRKFQFHQIPYKGDERSTQANKPLHHEQLQLI